MTGFNKKKIFKLAKGYHTTGKNCISVAAPRVHKALNYAYISRRLRRRQRRTEWIKSVNAAVREHDLSYNRFIYGLNHSNINLDRKILSELAITEPFSFKAVVDEVKVQTQIGLECSDEKPREKFSQAVADRLVALPGAPLPPLEDVLDMAKTKPYEYDKYFKFKYTKMPKPSEADLDEYRSKDFWESDWEDEVFTSS